MPAKISCANANSLPQFPGVAVKTGSIRSKHGQYRSGRNFGDHNAARPKSKYGTGDMFEFHGWSRIKPKIVYPAAAGEDECSFDNQEKQKPRITRIDADEGMHAADVMSGD